MSRYSQSDLGFIRALARELWVHNHKDYVHIRLAIEDAEEFIGLFNLRFNNDGSHAQADHDKPVRA